MPIVTIQVTREGVTAEQKAALIKGATDLLKDVLGKDPNLTFVIIQEVELENWGAGGLPTPEFRKRQAEKSSGYPSGRERGEKGVVPARPPSYPHPPPFAPGSRRPRSGSAAQFLTLADPVRPASRSAGPRAGPAATHRELWVSGGHTAP